MSAHLVIRCDRALPQPCTWTLVTKTTNTREARAALVAAGGRAYWRRGMPELHRCPADLLPESAWTFVAGRGHRTAPRCYRAPDGSTWRLEYVSAWPTGRGAWWINRVGQPVTEGIDLGWSSAAPLKKAEAEVAAWEPTT